MQNAKKNAKRGTRNCTNWAQNDDLLGKESCQKRHQKLCNKFGQRAPYYQRRAKDANC